MLDSRVFLILLLCISLVSALRGVPRHIALQSLWWHDREDLSWG